jgi:hypothetical protein
MSSTILQETKALKDLLLNPEMKVPDHSGRTKLIEKAHDNSALDPLSPQKKLLEEAVCHLVSDFKELDQITFLELDNYIHISDFSQKKIVETFKEFVLKRDIKEDIFLKATVARSIQHIQQTAFAYSYIEERFKPLQKLDPWLYAELVIACNWQKGIETITEQLKINNDSSYLFSIFPELMSNKNNKDDISEALSKWYPLFNEQDKKLADYYADNYGYIVKKPITKGNEIESDAADNILSNPESDHFFKNTIKKNYQTLSNAK